MIFSNKKAQITAFIIMGILLVAMVSLFFLLKKEESSETGGKIEYEVSNFFESCIQEDLEKAIKVVSNQGGYISNPLNISFKFKDTTKFENISYLCYTNQEYLSCINQEPLLKNHLEKEIGNNISSVVRNCFDESAKTLENRGEIVEAKYEGFSLEILPRRIIVKVDGEITSTKSGQTTTQKDIKGTFQSRLFEIAQVVEEINNQEATYCNFDLLGFMLFYPDFEIKKFLTINSTTIYKVKHNKGIEEFNFAVRSCSFPPTF